MKFFLYPKINQEREKIKHDWELKAFFNKSSTQEMLNLEKTISTEFSPSNMKRTPAYFHVKHVDNIRSRTWRGRNYRIIMTLNVLDNDDVLKGFNSERAIDSLSDRVHDPHHRFRVTTSIFRDSLIKEMATGRHSTFSGKKVKNVDDNLAREMMDTETFKDHLLLLDHVYTMSRDNVIRMIKLNNKLMNTASKELDYLEYLKKIEEKLTAFPYICPNSSNKKREIQNDVSTTGVLFPRCIEWNDEIDTINLKYGGMKVTVPNAAFTPKNIEKIKNAIVYLDAKRTNFATEHLYKLTGVEMIRINSKMAIDIAALKNDNVKKIVLENVGIQGIEGNKVEMLSLKNSQLKHLNSSLVPSLTHLEIDGRMTKLPTYPTFENVTHLEVRDAEIPRFLSLPKATSIHLDRIRNKAEFLDIPSVRELSYFQPRDHYGTGRVRHAFEGFPSLNAPILEKISIRGDKITKLGICSSQKLKEIDLRDTNIHQEEINCPLPELEKIRSTESFMRKINFIENYPKVKHVLITSKERSCIEGDLEFLSNLKDLETFKTNCDILDVEGLLYPPKLKHVKIKEPSILKSFKRGDTGFHKELESFKKTFEELERRGIKVEYWEEDVA